MISADDPLLPFELDLLRGQESKRNPATKAGFWLKGGQDRRPLRFRDRKSDYSGSTQLDIEVISVSASVQRYPSVQR
jgi:hypothetical protein